MICQLFGRYYAMSYNKLINTNCELPKKVFVFRSFIKSINGNIVNISTEKD